MEQILFLFNTKKQGVFVKGAYGKKSSIEWLVSLIQISTFWLNNTHTTFQSFLEEIKRDNWRQGLISFGALLFYPILRRLTHVQVSGS